MLNSGNMLEIYNDSSIQKLISEFLSKTEFIESLNMSFPKLIENIFLDVPGNRLKEYFKEFDKNNIDDNKWIDATTTIINNREYATFSNVGSIYFKKVLEDFIGYNKNILINEFISKYFKEKEIRNSILKELINSPLILTKNVAELLSGSLSKELSYRTEELQNAEIMFEVRSKETFSYSLPHLPKGQLYQCIIAEGFGVINIIDDNIIEYTPPTIFENKLIPFSLLVVDENGLIMSRNTFNIKVYPQKYFKPALKTYKLKPGSTLDIRLEEVVEPYNYVASVLDGFGSVEINNFFLSYTAPLSALSQNIGVSLSLYWNNKNKIYDTIVNFNVVVDESEVDQSDTVGDYQELSKQIDIINKRLENTENLINAVDLECDTSTIIDNSNVFIENSENGNNNSNNENNSPELEKPLSDIEQIKQTLDLLLKQVGGIDTTLNNVSDNLDASTVISNIDRNRSKLNK